MFTIYGGLQAKSDVDRLHLPTKDRGRGLIAIEDLDLAVPGLEVNVHGSEERLIQAAREDGLEAAHFLKTVKKEKRLQDWEEKSLHGQYFRQTKEVRSDQSLV